MLCSSCGKDNAATVSFCEYCGVDLRTTAPPGPPLPAGVPASAEAAAAAVVIAHAGKSLFNSLTLGEKFCGIGAAAAIVGFVVPFVSSPELGELLGRAGLAAGAKMSASLLDLGKFWGAVYFIFLAAAGSGLLFWFARSADFSRKLMMNAFQVMIGSLIGPMLMVCLLFVPMVQTIAGMGFWLTGLGFCAVAAGGIIAIAQVSKSVA